MKDLKPVRKQMLVHVVIVIAAGALWGLPESIAAKVNETINGGTPGYHPMPNIAGSVVAAQNMNAFIKNNQKVSFQQASEIAVKKTANGTVIGGHLGVVQGYLVYVFYIGNIKNKISYLTFILFLRKIAPRVAKSKAGWWSAKPAIIGAMAKAAALNPVVRLNDDLSRRRISFKNRVIHDILYLYII